MLSKFRKLLAAAGASAALLAASPANAWDLYIFYNGSGGQIGYQIIDDSGVVCEYFLLAVDGPVAYYDVISYPGSYC